MTGRITLQACLHCQRWHSEVVLDVSVYSAFPAPPSTIFGLSQVEIIQGTVKLIYLLVIQYRGHPCKKVFICQWPVGTFVHVLLASGH